VVGIVRPLSAFTVAWDDDTRDDDTPRYFPDVIMSGCDRDPVTRPAELTRDEIALVRVEAWVDADGWSQHPRLLWLDASRDHAHEIRLSPAWWATDPEVTLAIVVNVLRRRQNLVPAADAWVLVFEATRVMCDEDGREHSDRVRMADMATADGRLVRIVRPQALAAFEDAVTLVVFDAAEPRARLLLALAQR
jgi:hypothetical protein